MADSEEYLKRVIQKIASVTGQKPCNCVWAFERDCRRGGCGSAQMEAAEVLASYIKLEDIR